MYLTDRASCVREFYRLMNADATDDALTEHDETSTTLEGVYIALQHGADEAQEYLIACGRWDRWLKTSGTVTWSGSEAADGGRYFSLPTDFLRMPADEEVSALRAPSGNQWGRLVEARERNTIKGAGYYIRSTGGTPPAGGTQQVWVTREAEPPADLVLDYIYRIPTLTDSVNIDFDEKDRLLAVAFAAEHAMEQSWLPGGPEMEAKLERNLVRQKQKAWRRSRQTRKARKMRAKKVYGTHYYN